MQEEKVVAHLLAGASFGELALMQVTPCALKCAWCVAPEEAFVQAQHLSLKPGVKHWHAAKQPYRSARIFWLMPQMVSICSVIHVGDHAAHMKLMT